MIAPAPSKRMVVAFRVGARALAADVVDVAAVARRPALTRVPNAHAALSGLGALKGRATPIIELATLLGDGEGGAGGDHLLVLRGEDPVAVAVDHIEGIRERSADAAERVDLRETIAPVFRKAVASASRTVPAGPVAPTRPDDRERELSFVQFTLAGQSFAFPMAEVRAVVRAPAEVVAVPESDPVVRGLAPFGEGVLPVVELADLLGLPPTESAQCRLFVVEIGGTPVGLRVERALGALRIKSGAVSLAPPLLNRGAGEARVSAIARSSSGLTAILAAQRLFDEATMQRLNALSEPAPSHAPTSNTADPAEDIVLFRLGEERYGLRVANVEAVARPPADFAPPPNAPPFMAGIMSHRGEAVPVIHVRARFDAPHTAAGGAVIFVRRDAIVAGLLVDGVERVGRVARSKLQSAPSLAGDAGALFATVLTAELEGRPLLVVDADAMLSLVKRDISAWAAGRRSKGSS